jgi:hypothetical protein
MCLSRQVGACLPDIYVKNVQKAEQIFGLLY